MGLTPLLGMCFAGFYIKGVSGGPHPTVSSCHSPAVLESPPGAQVPTLGMVLGGSPGGFRAGAGPTSRHAGFRCQWALLHMFTGHPCFISGAKPVQAFLPFLCPLSCPYWLVGARMHYVL